MLTGAELDPRLLKAYSWMSQSVLDCLHELIDAAQVSQTLCDFASPHLCTPCVYSFN